MILPGGLRIGDRVYARGRLGRVVGLHYLGFLLVQGVTLDSGRYFYVLDLFDPVAVEHAWRRSPVRRVARWVQLY